MLIAGGVNFYLLLAIFPSVVAFLSIYGKTLFVATWQVKEDTGSSAVDRQTGRGARAAGLFCRSERCRRAERPVWLRLCVGRPCSAYRAHFVGLTRCGNATGV